MGFKTVYQCLHDLFPQVDYRILRAVAIEHPKDVDAAAEVVLLEILPQLASTSVVSNPIISIDSNDGLLNVQVEEEEHLTLSRNRRSLGKTSDFSSETRLAVLGENFLGSSDPPSPGQNFDVCNNNEFPTSLIQDHREQTDLLNSTCLDTDAEKISALSKVDIFHDNTTKIHGNIVMEEKSEEANELPRYFHVDELSDKVGSEADAYNISTLVIERHNEQENGEGGGDGHEGQLSLISDTGRTSLNVTGESHGEIMVENPPENSELSEHMNNSDFVKSNQDNIITLLEEMIDDAKSNKKKLFTAMESILKMMQDVEFKEKAAMLAKDEAEKGGLDVLAQVKELQRIIPQAKEANNMHAGEVYGEKAILATELRELQFRLLNLAEDRDGALAVLDEMAQSIQDRLSVAEDMRRAAEIEKLEKNESARRALSEIESIMQEVVNESKMLQFESEENSKLRQFLIDRGRVVDTLQGEISVICLDVRLLKEKFDDRVPLNKSISSSQTSCILASSGSSSLRNAPSNVALDASEPPKSSTPGSLASSVASCSCEGDPHKAKLDEERIISCDKVSSGDDEWEIFDTSEIAS